jgi:hypothetical protein
MGNSSSRSSDGEGLIVSSKLLERRWQEICGQEQWVSRETCINLLEAIAWDAKLVFTREKASRVIDSTLSSGGEAARGLVAHDDLENLFFLMRDAESEEVNISESLEQRCSAIVLPHLSIEYDSFEKVERLAAIQGLETWSAVHKQTKERYILRIHSLSYVRSDVEISLVLEEMRRLHCPAALKYVGSVIGNIERVLIVVYEDPETDLCCLQSYLEQNPVPMEIETVRKVFCRLTKGLSWLSQRKSFNHLQLRPENIFISPSTKKGWCVVGEQLLKRRFDMVDVR